MDRLYGKPVQRNEIESTLNIKSIADLIALVESNEENKLESEEIQNKKEEIIEPKSEPAIEPKIALDGPAKTIAELTAQVEDSNSKALLTSLG